MPRNRDHGAEQHGEFHHQAKPPSQGAEEPWHLGKQRMPAFQHPFLSGEVENTKNEDEQ